MSLVLAKFLGAMDRAKGIKPMTTPKRMTAERRQTIEAHLERHGMLPEEYAEEILAEVTALTRDLATARADGLRKPTHLTDAQIDALIDAAEAMLAGEPNAGDAQGVNFAVLERASERLKRALKEKNHAND